MKVGAILAAGGKGIRLGLQTPKPFIILNHHPLIYYSLKVLSASALVDYILVVVECEHIAYCQREIVEKYRFTKVDKVVSGGEKRQDSVYNGLKEIAPGTDLVLIHDGARPFVSRRLIKKIIDAAKVSGAAIPGITPVDTVKSINGGRWVEETLDRDSLVMIQTPQVFKYELIKEAYEKAYQDNFYATDDALLIRRLGGRVKLVKGEPGNIKITVPHDLLVAEMILRLKSEKNK